MRKYGRFFRIAIYATDDEWEQISKAAGDEKLSCFIRKALFKSIGLEVKDDDRKRLRLAQ